MEWIRGKIIGRGSFGTVNLAIRRSDCSHIPPLMAVKSSEVSKSASLQKEKEILTKLRDCPEIVRCFGDDFTVENDESLYNVFLEFASKGTLSDLVRNSSGKLLESNIRRYTRSILKGLCYIHKHGYVHCDIKLQNILLCSSSKGDENVKLADFGLAKRAGEGKILENEVSGFRGTPLCISPESVARNVQEPPSDIWSLGCIVSEMVTGKPAWTCRKDSDASALLFRIGFGEELPEIPGDLSEEGKDFLSRCFVRDSSKRWTAEMLLNHPFVADEQIVISETEKQFTSPRSAFDFPDWNFQNSSPSLDCYESFERDWTKPNSSSSSSSSTAPVPSPVNRIGELVKEKGMSWTFSETWVTVRQAESLFFSERN